MLINALCDYYDALEVRGKVLPEGYSQVPVSFMISLTPDGKIDNILDIRERIEVKTGKFKYKPKNILMPQRIQTTTVMSNIIDHRPRYIFGLDLSNSALTHEDKKSINSHNDFINRNIPFLEKVKSPGATALLKFIDSWNPAEETNNKFILALGNDYNKSNFVFCLSGHPEKMLHDDDEIRKGFVNLITDSGEPSSEVIAQCAVTGRSEPISRIHLKIKGVQDGQASGTTLIGCNNESEESYCHTQSYNSNISETAMKKYTESLNFLLSSNTNRTTLDGLTLIHWAKGGEPKYDDLFSELMFGDSENMSSEDTELMVSGLMKDAENTIITSERLTMEGFNPKVDFYFLGIKPNASRLAIKFFYKKQYSSLIRNISIHQNDLKIIGLTKPISLWNITRQFVSPKSKAEKSNPQLISKLLESILSGTKYPKELLQVLIRRTKTDTDITPFDVSVRMGLIKACINREELFKNHKEILNMSLDKENMNTSYLSGRLFAVLEKLQNDASSYKLNRTIKDAYFSAASSKPSSVFPIIMRLSQHHLKKVNNPGYYNALIGTIVENMGGEFPSYLPLNEQGKFIIGYYHQNKDLYTKKNDTQTITN